MTKRTLVRRFAVSILMALTLTGCTSGQPDQPDQRDDPPSPPPSSAETLADRDRTAVVAALRELDTCELLLAASAGLITPPSAGPEPSLIFPARCSLAADQTGTILVSLSVFDLWPQPTNYNGSERRGELNGATAFVDDTHPNQCDVSLPVSPETALELRASDPAATTSPCDLAESVAAAVVTTLDDPGQVRAAPRWGPCDALIATHGGTPDRYEETFDSASCTDTSNGARFSFQAGEPGTSGTESPGATPWRAEPIAGTQVWFSDHPAKSMCDAEWAAGPMDSPYSFDGSDVLRAQVTAKSCADARTVLEPLIGVLMQPPPEVAPQRPLLYQT